MKWSCSLSSSRFQISARTIFFISNRNEQCMKRRSYTNFILSTNFNSLTLKFELDENLQIAGRLSHQGVWLGVCMDQNLKKFWTFEFLQIRSPFSPNVFAFIVKIPVCFISVLFSYLNLLKSISNLWWMRVLSSVLCRVEDAPKSERLPDMSQQSQQAQYS